MATLYQLLEDERKKEYFQNLLKYLKLEYETKNILPLWEDVFNAFNYPFDKIKVVIIGQDPYPTKGVAHGYAFSSLKGIPNSLRQIFKEIGNEFNKEVPLNGDLTYLSDQGVLLLNTILTVEEGKPLSHSGIGWENFTNATLSLLNNHPTPLVFMIWGKRAEVALPLIDNPIHLVLKAGHPSFDFANKKFRNCNHFYLANQFLIQHGLEPICWINKKFVGMFG